MDGKFDLKEGLTRCTEKEGGHGTGKGMGYTQLGWSRTERGCDDNSHSRCQVEYDRVHSQFCIIHGVSVAARSVAPSANSQAPMYI